MIYYVVYDRDERVFYVCADLTVAERITGINVRILRGVKLYGMMEIGSYIIGIGEYIKSLRGGDYSK